MRLVPYILATAVGLTCASALAQTADAPRRMYPTQDGFLEVDAKSGAITECKRSRDGYQCTVVSQGDALLKEGPEAQTPAPATPPQAPSRRQGAIGPTDDEIDRALDVMERFLRRLMGIIREPRPDRT
jgi:hypothetical protein